jgi:hypothetical protein
MNIVVAVSDELDQQCEGAVQRPIATKLAGMKERLIMGWVRRLICQPFRQRVIGLIA